MVRQEWRVGGWTGWEKLTTRRGFRSLRFAKFVTAGYESSAISTREFDKNHTCDKDQGIVISLKILKIKYIYKIQNYQIRKCFCLFCVVRVCVCAYICIYILGCVCVSSLQSHAHIYILLDDPSHLYLLHTRVIRVLYIE
jgi:hypothetical protein